MTHHRAGADDHAHTDGHEQDRFSESAATWDEKPGAHEQAATIAAAIRAAIPILLATGRRPLD